jgi:hypothetical protein
MLERLTTRERIEAAGLRVRELIAAHGEWLYAPGEGRAFVALRRSEMELAVAHGRLIFTCWTEEGVRSWRVTAWEWTGSRLILEAKRRAGAERALIELVPRVSSRETSALISAARQRRAEHLASLASAAGAKVERVALSAGARRGEPGRYARIQLRFHHERIYLSGAVTSGEAYDVDAFLCSTLVWFLRQGEKTRAPLTPKLWLAADRKHLAPLAERLSLLTEELRRRLSLFELDDEWIELKRVRCPALQELWAKQGRARVPRPSPLEPSESAARIAAFAPGAIDITHARHGETLRYHGLPFARVRRVMSAERVWFGVADVHPRRLLDESTAPDLAQLLEQLREHRRADAPDTRHALYRLAPEAWLESLLRRDITRLDPGLRLAPLHAQFRAPRELAQRTPSRPVDLLALRQDGRLVVIELKATEDREHVIQGADYWRRVEGHRLAGNLARAQLFGDAPIADEPALVYLVAPTLSFHSSFATLARTINPRIRIYRFDLNEDWRAGVRVMRRVTLSNK